MRGSKSPKSPASSSRGKRSPTGSRKSGSRSRSRSPIVNGEILMDSLVGFHLFYFIYLFIYLFFFFSW